MESMLSSDPPILCIKDYEMMNLMGLVNNANSFNMIAFSLEACDPASPPEGQTCASEAEIDAYIQTKVLSVWVKTNYVVFQDVDKPIHSHFFKASHMQL